MADSYDYEVERGRRRPWSAWLLVPVALMALVVPFMVDRALETATSPEAAKVAAVDYQGARWVPSGAPMRVADGDMVRKGTSRDGRPLFLARAVEQRLEGGGGGGGGGGPVAERRLPRSVLFVKVRDGLYQPMMPR